MLWWVLLITIAVYVYYKLKNQHRYWKDANVPYLEGVPIFGNMADFVLRRKSMSELIQYIYDNIEGRYLGINFFGQPILVIKDLDLIKQVGIKDFDHFIDHKFFVPSNEDSLFSKVLFCLSGQRWKTMRATLSPAFTGSRMRAMFVLISENSAQFSTYFAKQLKPNEIKTIQLRDTYARFGFDTIATAAFGLICNSLEDRDNEFYLMGKSVSSTNFSMSIKLFGTFLFPRLMKWLNVDFLNKKANSYFRNLVKDTIQTREREGIYRPDMIHLLMEARKGKLKQEFGTLEEESFATAEDTNFNEEVPSDKLVLDDDYVVAQVFLFFLGGLDAISTMLGYATYELAVNMDVQERLQKEIDEVREECNGKFTYEVVLKMKYLDMVICEILRVWTAGVVLDRLCVKSYTIKPEKPGEVPVTLQKGDIVWIPAMPIHRDPQYYPDPKKFDPERFSDENKGNIKPFTYFPFGVGPRNCIASRLALLVMKTFLVHFLSEFTFVVTKETQIPPKLAKWTMNLQAEDGIQMGIKRRCAAEN